MTIPRASLKDQFIRLWKQPPAAGTIHSYPRLRNIILDIMAEGRRKNIVNLLLRVDVTILCQELDRLREAGLPRPTLTACIAQVFARTIDHNRSLQAYRLGRRKMVVFDEVDLAMMVERELDGHQLPIFHIIRAANHKGVDEIDQSLRHAKTAPLGCHGPLSRLEHCFFTLPTFLRRLVWWYIRRDPYLFKEVAGTVGVTSVGMHINGPAVGLPITPMSLTLSIGSLERTWQLEQNQLVRRQFILLNLGADHDVIDGGPLVRFCERFRFILESGAPLVANFQEE